MPRMVDGVCDLRRDVLDHTWCTDFRVTEPSARDPRTQTESAVGSACTFEIVRATGAGLGCLVCRTEPSLFGNPFARSSRVQSPDQRAPSRSRSGGCRVGCADSARRADLSGTDPISFRMAPDASPGSAIQESRERSSDSVGVDAAREGPALVRRSEHRS